MFDLPGYISPIALDFFGFGIRWYSLSYIFGFLYFFWFSTKHQDYFELDKKKIDYLFYLCFFGLILGGRLGYIIFYNFSYYLSEPISILKIWEGGMSFHGALIGIVIALLIFIKKTKSHFFLITDLMSLTAPLGIFFGRIANFFNSELQGRETKFFISVKYPNEEFYRHISQIYEGMFEGLIPLVILTLIFFLKKTVRGLMTGLFLIIYSVSRFSIEFIRDPDTQVGFVFSNITLGQILTIPIFTIGFYILLKCLSKTK